MRPLVRSKNALETKKLIRDHEIEIESESGIISVLGGKWTTHRAMAEDGIDTVLGTSAKPISPAARASSDYGAKGIAEYWRELVNEFGVSQATAHHLAEKFGTTP